MIIANLTVHREVEEDMDDYYSDKHYAVLKLGGYTILREEFAAFGYYGQDDNTLLECIAAVLRERLEGGFTRG